MASTSCRGPLANLSPVGSTATVSNGITLTAGGSIGGTADAAPFDYLIQSGNFDFSVRVQSLILTSPWAEAGLMARVTLDPASTFAGGLRPRALPSASSIRGPPPAPRIQPPGAFPVNYPNTWLRLQRLGTQFNGYASFDGSNWVQLGTATLAANPVYVGLVAASQNATAATVAQFAEFRDGRQRCHWHVQLPRESRWGPLRGTPSSCSRRSCTPPRRAPMA